MRAADGHTLIHCERPLADDPSAYNNAEPVDEAKPRCQLRFVIQIDVVKHPVQTPNNLCQWLKMATVEQGGQAEKSHSVEAGVQKKRPELTREALSTGGFGKVDVDVHSRPPLRSNAASYALSRRW